MNDDLLESTRVTARQQMLIPASPRDVCAGIGLNWLAAIKLWDDDWLSFDPTTTGQLDEAQEAELEFLGALVAAGCDPALLKHLLVGLRKPYSYRITELYFDWSSRRWQPLPKPVPPLELSEVFSSWVEELKEAGDTEALQELASEIKDAMRHVADKR